MKRESRAKNKDANGAGVLPQFGMAGGLNFPWVKRPLRKVVAHTKIGTLWGRGSLATRVCKVGYRWQGLGCGRKSSSRLCPMPAVRLQVLPTLGAQRVLH